MEEEAKRKARDEELAAEMKALMDQDLSEDDEFEDSEEDVELSLGEDLENMKRSRESSSPFEVGISPLIGYS